MENTKQKTETPPNQAVNELIGFLTPLAEGTLVPDFNIALRNVVCGVRDTGKDGSIALKLKIEPAKGSKSQLIVRASIEEKTPQPPRHECRNPSATEKAGRWCSFSTIGPEF